jgi:hypothetical protein
VIRIAISQDAFDAISATVPLGSVSHENGTNVRGERLIWLAPNVVNRLKAMHGPGQSYSDVILRLAAVGGRFKAGWLITSTCRFPPTLPRQ